MDLYKKEPFEKDGVELNFIMAGNIEYDQNMIEFVPNLSIIDVMMFNSKKEVSRMLDKYELV
jgi:hypothetical protein